MSDDSKALAKKLENANEEISRSLLQQEQQKRTIFAEEEVKHAEALSQVQKLYQDAQDRFKQLTNAERMLSSQAGQLLSALQREEARASKLSATVRKIRHTRKKMLGGIANPRWEVPHHYHMTCLEHALGHSQPHVLDVGQMVPGHLRLFTFARWGVLNHKSLIVSLNRAKCARSTFSEKIKEVYRSLRLTRQDVKEQSKLLEAMRKKSHLLGQANASSQSNVQGRGRSQGHQRQGHQLRRSMEGPNSIRMRYFKSLNMSPDNAEVEKLLKRWENDPTQNWKSVIGALHKLEVQSVSKNKAREELVFVESCRQRFNGGFAALPSPLGGVKGVEDAMEDLNLSDDEADDIEEQDAEALFISMTESAEDEKVQEQKAELGGRVEKGRLTDPKKTTTSSTQKADDLAKAHEAKELVQEQVKKVKKLSDQGSNPWILRSPKRNLKRGPSSRTNMGDRSPSISLQGHDPDDSEEDDIMILPKTVDSERRDRSPSITIHHDPGDSEEDDIMILPKTVESEKKEQLAN